MSAEIQKKLLTEIAGRIPENLSLVDILSELLEVSNDSVYRRLRGDTNLSIQETAKICSHFNISFDSVCNLDLTKTVSFQYNVLKSESDYLKYLISIRDDMRKIALAPDGQIIYAAEDIPLFHNFRFPELAAFKVFYWLKSVINDEVYKDMKFHRDCISQHIKNICDEIYKLYEKIPSIEIWSDVTPVSLLMQIDYFWHSGIFQDAEEAKCICKLAREAFDIMEKQAELSRKNDLDKDFPAAEQNFSLYQSGIEIGNNTILVRVGDQDTLYLTHNTFNKIVTRDRVFCNETEAWINNLIRKSSLLSGIAEKQRYQFFKNIRLKFQRIEDEIIRS